MFIIILTQRADLPHELLAQRIVAHTALGGTTRLALFRSCHALARMVLQHAHGSKRLSVRAATSQQEWPTTLTHLLGVKWQPLAVPTGLQLHVNGTHDRAGQCPQLPRCPPTAFSQHVSHLHLRRCVLDLVTLPAWRLHDAALWPQLRHLTLTDCQWPLDVPAGRSDLQPIPQLVSFTWTDEAFEWRLHQASLLALLPLVERATHLHMDFSHVDTRDAHVEVLRRLQRLTHAHLAGPIGAAEVDLLLRLPELQHAVLPPLVDGDVDFSQRACRWRTLTVLGGVSVDRLMLWPRALLRGLERLTIHKGLHVRTCRVWWEPDDGAAAGMALLQSLHSEGGRLVLEPCREGRSLERLGLRPGDAVLQLTALAHAAHVFHLALEAGRGVTALQLDARYGGLPLRLLREEVAPVLRQHAGKVTALCFHPPSKDEWCRGLLGAVPDCIVRVAVAVHRVGERAVRALVQGGVVSVRHPLTLTLLHWGDVDGALEAEMRQLALQSSHLSLELQGGVLPWA